MSDVVGRFIGIASPINCLPAIFVAGATTEVTVVRRFIGQIYKIFISPINRATTALM